MSDDNVRTDLDLNLLIVFDAIAEEGSLTRAGKRLGITQSAVSHSLKKLRNWTGDELFERTGKGMRPTARAQEMALGIRKALDHLRASIRGSQDFCSTTTERQFVLDFPGGIDAVIVPELAAKLAPYPNLTFRIGGGRARQTMSDLRYGESWLALDYEATDQKDFSCQKLFEDPFVVVSRRGHPMLKGGLDLKIFQQIDQIAVGWAGEPRATPAGRTLDDLGIHRKVRITVPTIGTLPRVVERTDLIGVMTLRSARSFAKAHGIEIHPIGAKIPPMSVFMVWHRSFDRDDGHVWFRGLLKDICDAL